MAPRTLPLGPTASLHNHTVWSDGEEEMAVMIRAARDAGLAVFGISDHWVCRPDGLVEDWAMPAHRLPDYVEALLAFRQQLETDSFRLLIGLEVDFFEENAAEVMAHLAQFPLDYTIGSAHFVGTFPVDHTREDWLQLGGQRHIDDIYHAYWQKLLHLCQSGLYDLVGHLDLPKKFAFRPSYDDGPEIEAVLQALRDSGMAMELNTAGWAKDCRDAYPAAAIVARAQHLGIPIAISTDSHHPSHIGRFVPQALQRLGGQQP